MKPAQQSKTIAKPQVSRVQTKYNQLRKLEEVRKDIYTEFEKSLKDMSNYSKENPNCRIYRNGRELEFGGR